MKLCIGIDNGVSGSLGWVNEEHNAATWPMPTNRELSYTKEKKFITRIDVVSLRESLLGVIGTNQARPFDTFVAIERPFVNPKMFNATLSAIRALEATLTVIETLGLPYRYIDSKEWQKALLPSGLKGTDELKQASLDVGRRIFPAVAALWPKVGDFDGLLIAEYLWRTRA